MKILFTADLHFTDNPRDEYRWGLLPWLAKMVRQHRVDLVIIGGDITDAKDKHSSVLVNRLVRGLAEIAMEAPIKALKGNHDYIDEGEPFFGFVNEFPAFKSEGGQLHGIDFLVEPDIIQLQGPEGKIALLPNTKDWEGAWSGRKWSQYELIFAHATFDGCESESGFKLTGIPPAFFKGAKKVWSGDIHKPQMVGRNIEYVGAPYRIRFGDAFKPRVVLLERSASGIWSTIDLHYRTQGKHLVEIINPKGPGAAARELEYTKETGGLTIYEGDQVKVRVRLPRSAYPDWPEIKAAIIEEAQLAKLQLTGPELVSLEEPAPKRASAGKDTLRDTHSPREELESYAEEKELSQELEDAGRRFLEAASAPG